MGRVNKHPNPLLAAKCFNGGQFKDIIMPNEERDYSRFPITVTIPCRTIVAQVEMYSDEDF